MYGLSSRRMKMANMLAYFAGASVPLALFIRKRLLAPETPRAAWVSQETVKTSKT